MCAQSRLHKIEVIKDDDEDWLQRYLANHPELLPMHDLEGHQTELRLIGREILDIDLLFVDRKGLLTLAGN